MTPKQFGGVAGHASAHACSPRSRRSARSVSMPPAHSAQGIADSFQASPLEVQRAQQASYLLMLPSIPQWHGAFRCPRAAQGDLVTLVDSVSAGASSPRIEHLWILRQLQGLAACCRVFISRAIVRDL